MTQSAFKILLVNMQQLHTANVLHLRQQRGNLMFLIALGCKSEEAIITECINHVGCIPFLVDKCAIL